VTMIGLHVVVISISFICINQIKCMLLLINHEFKMSCDNHKQVSDHGCSYMGSKRVEQILNHKGCLTHLAIRLSFSESKHFISSSILV